MRPYVPKWICKAFSGYARAIWEFEEPLPIDKSFMHLRKRNRKSY